MPVILQFEGFDLPSSDEYERIFEIESKDITSEMFGDFARESVDEVSQTNRRKPKKLKIGSGDVSELPTKIDVEKVVTAEYEAIQEVLDWIAAQLEEHSPVKTGKYQRSHRLFADGAVVPFFREAPFAREYLFVNIVPYARKIERGLSPQAPNGVYEVVAVLAQRRFHDVVSSIRFTFAYPPGVPIRNRRGRFVRRTEKRNPAIIVRL